MGRPESVDNTGTTRAVLQERNGRAVLRMLDRKGVTRFKVSVGEDGQTEAP